MKQYGLLIGMMTGGILCLTALSCENRIMGDWASTVQGTVVDSATGVPLAAAMITVEDTTGYTPVLTDSLGKFVLTELGGGWDIICRKEGYLTQSRSVGTTPSKHVVSGVDFRLVAAGR